MKLVSIFAGRMAFLVCWLLLVHTSLPSSCVGVETASSSIPLPTKTAHLAFHRERSATLSTTESRDIPLSTPTFLQLRGGASSKSSSSTCSSSSLHMIQGTLSDALQMARSQARLLVVYIPAKSKSKAAKSNNAAATKSLQSDEVASASNKRSRKKGDASLGSFAVWTAKSGSTAEVAAALKRLKAKYPNKGTSPILLVAYVAQAPVLDPTTGKPKLVPKILAQHHCNPPPNPTSMSSWLDALRKRHIKQYAAMQHHIKEAKLYEERMKGYESSQVEDRDREAREAREEAERQAKEQEERERKEAMQARREELLESLPDEPEVGSTNVVTIALRFADGSTGRRRFEADAAMTTVFNWVDAVYRMERERVELSTMTGQKKFTFDEVEDCGITLTDAGLGKMTGLRVAEISRDDDDDGEEEDDD